MGRIDLTAKERTLLKKGGVVAPGWGKGGQPAGQEKQRWYDKYGREFILPAMPDMDKFRRGRGLSQTPPTNPEPLVVVDPTDAIIAEMEAAGGADEYFAAGNFDGAKMANIREKMRSEQASTEQPPVTIVDREPRTLSWDVE